MRLLILLVLLTVTAAARADDPADSFPKFCDEWIEKLAARERNNVAHIKWESEGSSVKGDYVGYTREHTCVTKMGTQSTPVGKITYREIKYEKLGQTVEEAEHTAARAVETTEITEIFRYAEGQWIY
jgi:hypothetical protein